MALRPLLSRLAEHPDGATLIADGGRAFVSQSMRPYLVAALAEGAHADRPTLVVAGDDRQARDLAADLRAWRRPRPGSLSPPPGASPRGPPRPRPRPSSACAWPRSTPCSPSGPRARSRRS